MCIQLASIQQARDTPRGSALADGDESNVLPMDATLTCLVNPAHYAAVSTSSRQWSRSWCLCAVSVYEQCLAMQPLLMGMKPTFSLWMQQGVAMHPLPAFARPDFTFLIYPAQVRGHRTGARLPPVDELNIAVHPSLPTACPYSPIVAMHPLPAPVC